MRVQNASHNDGGESKAIADLLHERSSRAQSRGCDILSDEMVDDAANDQVHHRDERLTADDRFGVVFGIPHLTDNVEVVGRTGIGKDHDRHCVDSFDKSGLPSYQGDLVWSRRFDSDRNGKRDQSSHDGDDSDPTDPGHLVQCLNRRDEDVENSTDHGPHDSTRSVTCHRVESDGNCQKSRTSDGGGFKLGCVSESRAFLETSAHPVDETKEFTSDGTSNDVADTAEVNRCLRLR